MLCLAVYILFSKSGKDIKKQSASFLQGIFAACEYKNLAIGDINALWVCRK